ncbi:MAG3090 family protein [Mycoplasma sp. 4423]
MKRLLCLYKPALNKNYPWVLKHPKVKDALAQFKTRKDAMNWFLSLGYDCATWFQTDQKVFGGIFISEWKEGVDFYEINVDKFDGNVVESDVLSEFFIDSKTGARKSDEARDYLERLNDFKVLRKHETYFPVDDEFIIERKKSAKDLEIEKLQRLNEELQKQGQAAPVIVQEVKQTEPEVQVVEKIVEVVKEVVKEVPVEIIKEVEVIKEVPIEIIKEVEVIKEVPFEVVKEIEVVKEVPLEVVKEVEVTKEVPIEVQVIKEVKVPVEKVVEVIKEVVKEVPVEVVKEVSTGSKEPIRFEFIENLQPTKQLEALAVYAQRISKVAEFFKEEKTTSEQDLTRIKEQLKNVLVVTKKLSNKFTDDKKAQKLFELVAASLATSVKSLSEKIVGKPEIEFNPETAVYYRKECGRNVLLVHWLSYLVFEGLHLAFVPQQAYHYPIIAAEVKPQTNVVVFSDVAKGQPKEESEVVVTEERIPYMFWTVLFASLALAILFVLVILLWVGVIPPLN